MNAQRRKTMSKISEYIIWCEEEGYTNENGDVVSMKFADLYMQTMAYEKEHREFSKSLVMDAKNTD